MKVFFFLGQTFFDQSMLMAEDIENRYPGSEFSAIVCARYNIINQLDNLKKPNFKRYDWLNALEKQWLASPLDKAKVKKYEDLLGTETLRRILISDRELASGYVSCGIVENTRLIDLTRYDDDVRWSYIIGLVDYLFTVFEKERPDLTFAYCIAGAVATAIAEVSKHLGILFTQPIFTRIGHYYIMDINNSISMLTPVQDVYNRAKESPEILVDAIPKAKQYLDNFRNRPEKPQDTVTWSAIILKKTNIIGIAKTIAIDIARWGAISLGLKGTRGVLRQRKGFEILHFNLKNILILRKLSRKTNRSFSYEIPTGEYIYYPLHVDPEASTMVLSPFHTDQANIIEAISKNMPVGMKLVVKEHLPCAGKRPQGFYERIRRIPGVILVSPLLDNFMIIKNATLISTITGTVGLEAIMMGKPLLVFGKVHYQIIEKGFVYHPEISVGLGDAIKNAFQLKPAADSNIINYLTAIMTEGIEISPDDIWFESVADLTNRKQAVSKIVDKILEHVVQFNKEASA